MEDQRELPTAKLTPLHAPTTEGKQVSKVVDIPAGITWNLRECGAVMELPAYVQEGTVRLTIAGAEEEIHAGDCFVLNTHETVRPTFCAPDRDGSDRCFRDRLRDVPVARVGRRHHLSIVSPLKK